MSKLREWRAAGMAQEIGGSGVRAEELWGQRGTREVRRGWITSEGIGL